MNIEQIDRDAMQTIAEIEVNLNLFRAFRQIWAELVANRKKCGIDREVLEEQQCKALSLLLGHVEALRTHFGMKFMTTLPNRGEEHEEPQEGHYLCKRDTGSMQLGVLQEDGFRIQEMYYDGLGAAINDGWKLDGPIRSPVHE